MANLSASFMVSEVRSIYVDVFLDRLVERGWNIKFEDNDIGYCVHRYDVTVQSDDSEVLEEFRSIRWDLIGMTTRLCGILPVHKAAL